jgi:hypothetical protein
MATHVLSNGPVKGFKVSLAHGFAVEEPKISLRRSSGFIEDHGSLFVSTQAGLQGARAALTAIGLEALVALAFLTCWLVFRANL